MALKKSLNLSHYEAMLHGMAIGIVTVLQNFVIMLFEPSACCAKIAST
jgi:hypothetical protein